MHYYIVFVCMGVHAEWCSREHHIIFPRVGHRYPTRWKLGRHNHNNNSSSSSLSLDTAKDKLLVPCKRKKEEKRNLYLPQEIIFNILVFIPAKLLHEVLKYVCKQWYDIVSDPRFIVVHRQLCSDGFLIHEHREMFRAYNIETYSARLKVTQIQFPSPVRVLGSFNGLVLLHDLTNPDILHVANPVTKAKISLPPVAGLSEFNTGFALDSSGRYKVVHVSGVAGSYEVKMRILTVGVDKAWRFVDLQGVYVEPGDLFMSREVRLRKSRERTALLFRQHFIAGFIYWYCTASFIGFSLDVNTETIYQFYEPMEDICNDARPARFFSMGTCLGLIKEAEGAWRVWKLTGMTTSEWTEVAGIEMLPALNRLDKMFYPNYCCAFWPALLSNEDFWLYRCINTKTQEFVVVRYNLGNENFVYFPVKTVDRSTRLIPHVNTLFSPQNLLA